MMKNLHFFGINNFRQIDGTAPAFAKKPSIRQEDDGELLLFECRVTADPAPEISWFHNGSPVHEKPGRFKIIVQPDGGHNYNCTLQVSDVTVEDAGKYKVVAKNELGESNATISLNFDSDDANVPEGGTKPTFIEKPTIKQSDDGNRITFECALIADPSPVIKWFLNGTHVPEGARHKYRLISDKHNHTAALDVSKVKAEDGGEYKVVATNAHGEGHANITLNFDAGKPK